MQNHLNHKKTNLLSRMLYHIWSCVLLMDYSRILFIRHRTENRTPPFPCNPTIISASRVNLYPEELGAWSEMLYPLFRDQESVAWFLKHNWTLEDFFFFKLKQASKQASKQSKICLHVLGTLSSLFFLFPSESLIPRETCVTFVIMLPIGAATNSKHTVDIT